LTPSARFLQGQGSSFSDYKSDIEDNERQYQFEFPPLEDDVVIQTIAKQNTSNNNNICQLQFEFPSLKKADEIESESPKTLQLCVMAVVASAFAFSIGKLTSIL